MGHYNILGTVNGQAADAAVTAAERRGLPIPDTIATNRDMHAAVTRMSHMTGPARPHLDHVPDSVDDLRAAVGDYAQAHARAAELRQAAGDWAEPVARKYNALVREAAPGWIAALQPEFLRHVKTLRAQAGKLPDNLDKNHLDWNDPKVTGPWEAAEAAAIRLDQLVTDRQTIAKAASLDLGADAALHAVALFPEPTIDHVLADHYRDHIRPVITGWKNLRGQPVSRWLMLARAEQHGLTLTLARPDEVGPRRDSVERWIAGQRAKALNTSRNGATHAVRAALAA